MSVSTTEALAAEVDRLREEVIDLGEALTDQAGREAARAQRLEKVLAAIVEAFGAAREPLPACLRDEGPELCLIRGGQS